MAVTTVPPWSLDAIAWAPAAPDRWSLTLAFSPEAAFPQLPTVDDIALTDIRGVARLDLSVLSVALLGPGRLGVEIAAPADAANPALGDVSPIILWMVGLDWIEPTKAFAGFVPAVELASQPTAAAPSEQPPAVTPLQGGAIDYLCRDYDGLRGLMLARLSAALSLPVEDLDRPADPLATLVETLAAAGDYLAYYQDAVGTEAYLATARRRLSLHRHARLVDYAVDDGCNARAWIRLTPTEACALPAGTPIVSAQPGQAGAVQPRDAALADGTTVFETLYDVTLSPDREALTLVRDPDEAEDLPVGAIGATLSPACPWLRPGQVLLFEPNPLSTSTAGITPHPVRVTDVAPLGPPEAPTGARITWSVEDALPYAVDLTKTPCAAVVSANLVLADHGRSAAAIPLPPVPARGDYRPTLPWREVCHAQPFDPGRQPLAAAAACVRQDPRQAVPAVRLTTMVGVAPGPTWTARRDLWNATAQTRAFVVEPDDQEEARLRFGDGVFGRPPAPGQAFAAVIRHGGGSAGAVGPGFLVQALADLPLTKVVNPLAAVGGGAAEADADIRRFAPDAFRRQRRAVSLEDHVDLALELPMVAAAGARLIDDDGPARVKLVVEPVFPIPPGPQLHAAVAQALARFQVVGPPLGVSDPEIVGLDIALSVYAAPRTDPVRLRTALDQALGAGPGGYFDARRPALGRSIYLGDLVAAALKVEGVAWVDADPRTDPRVTFGTIGARGDGLSSGVIRIEPTQAARVDNDPLAPDRGRILFQVMQGP